MRIVYDKHMAIRATVFLGDPLLRRPCPDLALGDPRTGPLADDLRDTLADWVRRTSYGRGIAAPQIGAGVRLVHASLCDDPVLVNPYVTGLSAETWEPWETCLSFGVQVFCRVPRAVWADVEYRTPDGARRMIRAEGDLAHLLQHEIDHLDGILAVDRMTDASTLCLRTEFEARHRDESPYRPCR